MLMGVILGTSCATLVRLVAARGSLLCERVPVFHFLPFVFETIEPVSESLSAGVDAQLHTACRKREEQKQKSQEVATDN